MDLFLSWANFSFSLMITFESGLMFFTFVPFNLPSVSSVCSNIVVGVDLHGEAQNTKRKIGLLLGT